MKNLPTDLEILQAIYGEYHDEFERLERVGERKTLPFLSIDSGKLAARLRMSEMLLIERLVYMEQKYGYKTGGVHYSIFPLDLGEVNFAFMTSLLAELQNEHRTARNNTIAAAVSAIGAIVSAIFAALSTKG